MMAGFLAPRVVEASCTVEIEQTAESFHAYAVPEGVEVREGDVVLIHDAPTYIEFGEKLVQACKVTVVRAGPLTRLWARLVGLFSLTDLYEVGFDRKDGP